MHTQLKQTFDSSEAVERFMSYLERMDVDEGQVLIRQGDPPAAMYFVETGELTARLEISSERSLRLRTMGPGSTVGEIGMYLKRSSTATVAASCLSVVHKLSADSLARMEADDPALASSLHRWIVLSLSQRLSDNNRTLEALLN